MFCRGEKHKEDLQQKKEGMILTGYLIHGTMDRVKSWSAQEVCLERPLWLRCTDDRKKSLIVRGELLRTYSVFDHPIFPHKSIGRCGQGACPPGDCSLGAGKGKVMLSVKHPLMCKDLK